MINANTDSFYILQITFGIERLIMRQKLLILNCVIQLLWMLKKF